MGRRIERCSKYLHRVRIRCVLLYPRRYKGAYSRAAFTLATCSLHVQTPRAFFGPNQQRRSEVVIAQNTPNPYQRAAGAIQAHGGRFQTNNPEGRATQTPRDQSRAYLRRRKSTHQRMSILRRHTLYHPHTEPDIQKGPNTRATENDPQKYVSRSVSPVSRKRARYSTQKEKFLIVSLRCV